MLTVTATLTVKAGQEHVFERIMRMAVPKVREEPGNHVYSVQRSTQDPRLFMFHEVYEDQAALEAHYAHLSTMGLDLHALLDESPHWIFHDTVISSEGDNLWAD